MPAAVVNRQRRVPVDSTRLRRTADRALSALGRRGGDVEIDVVDDAEIRRLNEQHRGIRRRTDVLSFPLEVPGSALVGQIVISADAAVRQAHRVRVPVATELELLVTHGILHLVDWDDRDPLEADLMHRREREILSSAPERLWTGLLSAPDRSASRDGGASEVPRRPVPRIAHPRRLRPRVRRDS